MIYKICLILILFVVAQARPNPFEATDQFKIIKIKDDITSSTIKQNNIFKVNNYITVSIYKNELTISTKNHKIIKSIIFDDIGKIMIDFGAKVRFKSKTIPIAHDNIKSITVGTHYPQNFYRVVIRMSEKTKKYKIIKGKALTTIRF